MSTQLALIDSALSVGQVVQQRHLVMSLMREAMTEGQHYGKIPGCGDKPSLLQPGAQLMATTFRLFPSYEIRDVTLENGHREYTVICTMHHDGVKIAEGLGFCSSMESKHRYRSAEAIVEDTGDPVPRAYWDNEDKKAALAQLSVAYDGQKVRTKKIEGQWRIVIVKGGGEGKSENPNPADVFNTVLKMAKKRAYVDATISATACNDLFTQDLEDIRENIKAVEAEVVEESASQPAQQPPIKPTPPALKNITVPGVTWTEETTQNRGEPPVTFHLYKLDSGMTCYTANPELIQKMGVNKEKPIDLVLQPGANATNKIVEVKECDEIPT